MESASLTFIFVLSFAVFSSQFGVPDWDDVLVAREGMPTTLVCTDDKVRGAVAVNWLMKPARAKDFKLVLSASEKKERSGEASNESMRLTDPNFQDSGDFSLFILPKIEDSGYYSCLIKQQKLKLKERIILLAILTVSVAPPAPILQQSILRLTASVNPGFAITKITWEAPGGNTMKSESTNKGIVAKLPMVQRSDGGAYVCVVYPLGNSSSPFYRFSVDVTVADKVIPSNNITYRPVIRTATQEGTPLPLTCPDIRGDYVDVYWLPPDSTRKNMKLVHHYDRWRGNGSWNDKHDRLKPAGSPYNADTGSFSFLLTPTMKDGGLYSCSVYLNDHVTSQKTRLSVLKVTAVSSSTRLELGCRYTERSIVRSAKWKHQNESRQLRMTSKLGSISIFLPLPITSDTAGNYTCIIQLTSGQTVSAKHEVKPPFVQGNEESVSVTTPSLLPSLSALLLLVPLVAVAVSVLLWRQKHISDRGIEQSLSVSSGEVENVYENPEDIRQAPPQGSVYMDLKPRGEDDVYKELERFEQCQG